VKYAYQKSPLVTKYFDRYLQRLIAANSDCRFGHLVNDPDRFESMLQYIENDQVTQRIIREIGDISDPEKLCKRLLDAWAELRTVVQLKREAWHTIRKHVAIIDLFAQNGIRHGAFQVTRINTTIENRSFRTYLNQRIDLSPTGPIDEMYARLKKPLSDLFWNPIDHKNQQLRQFAPNGVSRSIVLVTSEEPLQDPMIRHISCKCIAESMNTVLQRYFDEIVWLPDMGNGAIFTFDESGRVVVNADWHDEPGRPYSIADAPQRIPVNLDADY
jgi:hypothetical protein